jgi:transposase
LQLKPNDLRQLDADTLRRLHQRDPDALVKLSVRLLDDLKEAHERLNQSSHNSSRPPSSCGPWHKPAPEPAEAEGVDLPDPEPEVADAAPGEAPATPAEATPTSAAQPAAPRNKASTQSKRRPGKQPGAPGVARTQEIPFTATIYHRPPCCACCGGAPAADGLPWTAFGELGVELGSAPVPSLTLTHTRHVYFETRCDCGHVTRAEPYRAPPPDADLWKGVEVSEWRLIGPSLAGLLVWLRLRMRLSAGLAQEFLRETLGLELSTGAIAESLLESARATDPAQELLLAELMRCEPKLLHADETPWYQAGKDVWLWTLLSTYAVVFAIGPRSKATFAGLLSALYTGWLMTDGYQVYRDYPNRLRCWAHLLRKAQALVDSLTPWAVAYGRKMLHLLHTLMEAIYAARRAGVQDSIRPHCQGHLDALRALCERMEHSTHEKTRQLGFEFLNDWDAIFRVIDHPHLPLTNNEAERVLRPWVILRRITYGTRTPQGSRAFNVFAGIIETCRRRAASPLRYLQQVIAAGRQGLAMPSLPPIPCGAVGG